MPEQKIYVPKISAKEHTFRDGGTMIKLGINVDATIEFLKQHANSKGYVNLCIARRREVSQYGETHSVYLDTFVPGQQPPGGGAGRQQSAPAGQKTQAQLELERRSSVGRTQPNPAPKPVPAKEPWPPPDKDDSDVPF